MEGYCEAVATAVSAARPFGQPDRLIRERHDTVNEVLDRVVDNLILELGRAGIVVNPSTFRRLAS